MTTVFSLIEEACDKLSQHEKGVTRKDVAEAIRCLQIARAKFDQAPVQRASRLLYTEMDKWATFEKGHIRVEVLVDLLKQEGLLATQEVDSE